MGRQEWYVPLAPKGDVMFTLPKYPANQKLSAEIVYKAPLKPPVKKGDQVAVLKITSTSSAAVGGAALCHGRRAQAAGSCGKASIHSC